MSCRSLVALLLLSSAVACSAPAEEDDSSSGSENALTGTGPSGSTPAAGSTVDCQVLVVGAGTGGMAAAIASARIGMKTCVTEETDWAGGQLTSQGLNASDDNRFTDTVGSTHTFRQLRSLMRASYGGKSNPGGCWVSYLCAEPKAALDALAKMTKPFVDNGSLRVFYNIKADSVTKANGKVTGAVLKRTADGGKVTFRASQTIDATELGDVIKLSGAGYRVGQEPKSDTGEADAPDQGCTECVQALTYDVALEKRPTNENHTIPKPDGYGVKPWMKGFTHKELPNKKFFDAGSEWTYRRIIDGASLGGRTDISIMNWSSQPTNDPNAPYAGGNDYPFASILDKSDAEVATQLGRARERALAYVYWLQTEADGRGYPYLKLRGDVMGTDSGLAKMPYIREGRRLRALETIKVEDVSDSYNKNSARAREWDIPVAIGLYPLDMHTNTAVGTGYPHGKALPYQVPMGALIPEQMNGLIAGAKNIGTTHMTNAAYRLHPIEWAIGEAAGTLAAYSASWGIEARDAFANEGHARELQDRLLTDGAPLYWMDDVTQDNASWKDIQLAAATGIMGGPELGTLHFRPEQTVTRAQAAAALVKMLGLTPGNATGKFADVPADHWAAPAIELLASKGIVTGTGNNNFSPSDPVTSAQMKALIGRSLDDATAAKAVPNAPDTAMNRGQAAVALVRAYRARINLP